MTLYEYTLRLTEEDREWYWEVYSKHWVPWYLIKIQPKCSLAAIALGLWLEREEGEKEEIEEWINTCLQYGLYKIRT